MSTFPFISIISQVEDALVATIKGAEFGYSLGTVASYGGELLHDDDAMALLLKKFPAVWVAFSSEREPEPVKLRKDKYIVDATFLLLVATRSARGELFTRHSASVNEVGAYQLISDLRLLLLNQDLGLPIEAFRPGAVKNLSTKKIAGEIMAAFAVELKCKYVLDQRDGAAAPGVHPIGPAGGTVPWTAIDFNFYLQSTSEAAPDAVDSFPLPFSE